MFGLITLIPGVLNGLLSWLNKRTDADLEKYKTAVGGDVVLNTEELRARVALAQMNHDSREKDREHWFTAWMVPVTFAVFLIHAAAVVFDSMPLFGHVNGSWGIDKLPGQYADMQYNVILGVCGIGVVGGIKKIFSR